MEWPPEDQALEVANTEFLGELFQYRTVWDHLHLHHALLCYSKRYVQKVNPFQG